MRRRPLLRLALLLLCTSLCIQALNRSAPSGQAPGTYRCRLEGVIVEHRRNSLVVEGEIDLSGTPATRTRVLLRMSKPMDIQPGATILVFCNARRPTNTTLPFVFNEYEYCSSKNIFFVCEQRTARIHILREPNAFQQALHNTRTFISNRITTTFEPDVAVFVNALVLGNDSELDADVRSAYSNAGTAHVLSVSGMHVSLVGGMLFLLCGGQRRRKVFTITCCVFIGCYVVLTGAESPAVRAGIMCCIALYGNARERSVDGLNILGFSIILQFLWDPQVIMERGFILSTAATYSILAIGPPLYTMLTTCFGKTKSWKRAVANTAAINLSASAGTAVPVAFMFGQAAVWSIAANLVVIPLFSVALLGSIVVLLLQPVSSVVAEPIIWCVQLSIRAATETTTAFSNITPSLTTDLVLLTSLAWLAGTLWLTRSTSFASLLTRSSICIGFVVALLAVPSQRNVALYCMADRSSLEMVVVASKQTFRARLFRKNGAVFVRSSRVTPSPGI